MKNVLVISAHADDEAFGMGGTLLKLRDAGVSVHWLILTKIWTPRWSQQQVKKRENEINQIVKQLNLKSLTHWEYQDNKLDTYPIDELQAKLIKALDLIKPDTIFTPSPWDFNFEHRFAFELVEMSSKPFYSPYIKTIIAYEIPSSTDWGLGHRQTPQPNWFVDIENYNDEKWQLCSLYENEVYNFPHPRSKKGVQAFANKHACESGTQASEAFWKVREIWK
jgi:N-acetylglucosamine malate deacetylase 1